ncbi:MAG: ABC transporter substrate-binding protein [Pseudomonadota bacterium]
MLLAASAAAGANCEPGDTTRLAVAGGSITEIIYLLGAEDRLGAVDTTSNYPPEALELPSIGYVRALSAEGLLSLNPTLILGEDDMGPPEVLKQIEAAGVPTRQLEEIHTADGVVSKVRCIGKILDMREEADAVISSAIAPTVARLPQDTGESGPRVALLLNLTDGTPTAAGDTTSGHGLLAMAGADNVFAAVDGWKPVALEAMVGADPEYIVMPERGLKAAGGVDAVAGHPAIRLTTAGRRKQIIAMDGMAMLGFGPRTINVAAELAEVFAKTAAAP